MPLLRACRIAIPLCFTVAGLFAADAPPFERKPDGIAVHATGQWIALHVRDAGIVRIVAATDRTALERTSMITLPTSPLPPPKWIASASANDVTLATEALQVVVDRRDGRVRFLDRSGVSLLEEQVGGRRLEPATVQGERTYHLTQRWESTPGESLYGLGQHQLGAVDIAPLDLDLWQHNGTVIVPFLVSSRGYGILWDNTAYSRFGDLREFAPLPAKALTDADGASGGVTASYYDDATFEHERFRLHSETVGLALPTSGTVTNTAIHPGLPPKGAVSVRWQGTFAAPSAGSYLFEVTSDGATKVWIDDACIVDNWWHEWLPHAAQARVTLPAGPHRVRVDWTRDHGGNLVQLRWKPPVAQRPITLWSETGEAIDYTFVYGPKLDRVLAGYRQITGRASLAPIWAFGLWQSRQRYETAQQSLDVLAEFRRRGIPVDTMVQDWFYWRKGEWGSHAFDPERFPDPQGWIDAIHRNHARLMLSVWGKFYPGTSNYDALHARGFLYREPLWEGLEDWLNYPYTDYDAFNPAARAMFWAQIRDQLFTKKVDAWWMDATEPDVSSPPVLAEQKRRMNPTAAGTSARVLNAYALMNSRGVYEGQRAAAPDQRVFILTRSGFAGIQRYGSATWSGDMPCTWTAMREQIAAGLGYAISGVPYWSMDIGGFTAPAKFQGKALAGAALDEWSELNARWFEFGTFVPLVRLHGESQFREPWAFGGPDSPACAAIVKFDRLRYRLLPYVYSLAGAVTQEDTTFLRPLVMDFPADATARTRADEYLFGPAFLVAPVTEYKARTRLVYLPDRAGGWYDFWTGGNIAGGKSVSAAAPFDAMPLFVPAGAIIPFGPELQYTTEKPADPITLFVYTGASGSFTLYEDDGLTYGYERGEYARIPLTWNDADRTLTIGRRTGSFPGLHSERTLHLVPVSPRNPTGFSFTAQPAQTLTYRGEALSVRIE